MMTKDKEYFEEKLMKVEAQDRSLKEKVFLVLN